MLNALRLKAGFVSNLFTQRTGQSMPAIQQQLNKAFHFLIISQDLCININNHQNAIFHQLDKFMKHSHSFAMTIFQ
jgi:hypothetical protein